MQKIFFTPGPSHLYPTVPSHLNMAVDEDILSISHRGKEFKRIFTESITTLKLLLSIPDDYHIVFLSSATEAMERSIQGLVKRKSFHFTSGAFGDKYYEIAKLLGKDAHNYKISFDSLKKSPFISDDTELICFTHNETSNGSTIPLETIYTTRRTHPDSLIAIDVVSSIPYVDLDYQKFDVVFFSVQKGFGLPSGLGVLILSPRAYRKAMQLEEEGWDTGSYHKLTTLIEQASNAQTVETPNVLVHYLFSKVIEDMLDKGISKIRQEIDIKAKLLYDFFDTHVEFSSEIPPLYRSRTVLVINHPQTNKLHTTLQSENMIIGKGYGKKKDDHIRIANFPALESLYYERLLHFLR